MAINAATAAMIANKGSKPISRTTVNKASAPAVKNVAPANIPLPTAATTSDSLSAHVAAVNNNFPAVATIIDSLSAIAANVASPLATAKIPSITSNVVIAYPAIVNAVFNPATAGVKNGNISDKSLNTPLKSCTGCNILAKSSLVFDKPLSAPVFLACSCDAL